MSNSKTIVVANNLVEGTISDYLSRGYTLIVKKRGGENTTLEFWKGEGAKIESTPSESFFDKLKKVFK